jgi:hypothetical protein
VSESVILVPRSEDLIKIATELPGQPKLWLPPGAGKILRASKDGGLVQAVQGDLAEAIRAAARDNPIAGGLIEAIEAEIKRR